MVDMIDYSEDEFNRIMNQYKINAEHEHNLRIKNTTFNKSNNTIVIQFETGYMIIVPISSIEGFN